MTIHDKTLRPLVDEFGYDLMPNTLTEAAIQGVLIERQPKPYPSKCFKDWSQTNYSNYIQNDWNYTLQQCQRACSHSTILESCGCWHPLFLDTDAPNGKSACNMTSSSKDYTCIELIMHQLDNR